MNGKAEFLERLAKAQRKEADDGHKDAEALRVRATKNEAIVATLRSLPEATEAQRGGIKAVYEAARGDGYPVPRTFGEFLAVADLAMVPMFQTTERALEFTLPGEAHRYSITPEGDVL